MTPRRWLIVIALAVAIPVACRLAGEPSCEDQRGIEACAEAGR